MVSTGGYIVVTSGVLESSGRVPALAVEGGLGCLGNGRGFADQLAQLAEVVGGERNLGRGITIGAGVRVAVVDADAVIAQARLQTWCDSAGITAGPLFRAVPTARPLNGDSINQIVRGAVQRAGVDPDIDGYRAHSLRAGSATFAAERGLSDRSIQRQTRHKHASTVAIYTRHESAWTDNAATELGRVSERCAQPGEYGCKDCAAAVHGGEFVVAGRQTAPVLQGVEGPFDDVAAAVGEGVVGDRSAAA